MIRLMTRESSGSLGNVLVQILKVAAGTDDAFAEPDFPGVFFSILARPPELEA